MKHFEWMVIDHIDKMGIWFKGTITGSAYIFYWNPIRTLYILLTRQAWFGWFPMHKNHIKWLKSADYENT